MSIRNTLIASVPCTICLVTGVHFMKFQTPSVWLAAVILYSGVMGLCLAIAADAGWFNDEKGPHDHE